MDIYTKRSHIVNRRLIGAEILGFVRIQNDDDIKVILDNLLLFDKDSVMTNLELNQDVEEIKESQGKVAVVKRVLSKNKKNKPELEVIVNGW